MKTRHAYQIRCGILAARTPELLQHIHASPRLVRKAARRETQQIVYRSLNGWRITSLASIAARRNK